MYAQIYAIQAHHFMFIQAPAYSMLLVFTRVLQSMPQVSAVPSNKLTTTSII